MNKKKKNDRKDRKYTKDIEYHYYEGYWSKVPDFSFLSDFTVSLRIFNTTSKYRTCMRKRN